MSMQSLSKYILLSILVLSLNVGAQHLKQEVLSGEAIVKLLPEHRHFFTSKKKVGGIAIQDVNQIYGQREVFNETPVPVDLSLIYQIKSTDPDLLSELKLLGVFEYVEPRYVYHTAHTPNDPELNNQFYLQQVSAYDAWDKTKGNAQVTIGIVDTGTDLEHPDLKDKINTNDSDPVNGIDDDRDGYVDNFQGWDFVDNDHLPQIGESSHGAHVSGIAAAASNNGEGVASIGYNCTYLPIRVGNGSAVTHGFEGIAYAADMGCEIINCSWGGGAYSQYGQDVINYATLTKGALVVAASGNNGRDMLFYPAAYQNVLAVGSVNSLNLKSGFSNWGYYIDVLAPGQNVQSTVDDGGYARNTGTSMACPMVSALAGLVKSQYPQLTPRQIEARIKSSATNIDNSNSATANKNGYGLINCSEAVNGLITDVFIDFSQEQFTNNNDEVFKIGDDIELYGVFTNALSAASNVEVTLSSASSAIILPVSNFIIGDMASTEQVDNYDSPFKIKVRTFASPNERVLIEMRISSDQGSQKQFYEITVAENFRNVEINKVGISVGSKGQMGFNNKNQTQGIGMRYLKQASQLYEGGLMIGLEDDNVKKVLDNIRSTGDSYDNDFAVRNHIEEGGAIPSADYLVHGVFNDDSASFDSIGLEVSYQVYASSDLGNDNFVIAEYDVINKSGRDLENLAVGIFADFDVADYSANKALTDFKRYMMYTISASEIAPVFGVQLLSNQEFSCYAIDNISGGAGGVDMANRFMSADKFQVLTNYRSGAGMTSPQGNDVAQVVGGRNIFVAAQDTVKVVFAFLSAADAAGLRLAADSAYSLYNGIIPNSISELNNEFNVELYPNPVGQILYVESGDRINLESVKVLNVLGQYLEIPYQKVEQKRMELRVHSLKAGLYFVECQTKEGDIQIKMFKKL